MDLEQLLRRVDDFISAVERIADAQEARLAEMRQNNERITALIEKVTPLLAKL